MTHKNKDLHLLSMFFSNYLLLIMRCRKTRRFISFAHSLKRRVLQGHQSLKLQDLVFPIYIYGIHSVADILVNYTNMYTTNSGQGNTLPASPRREALAPKIGVWFGGDEEVLNPTSLAKSQ
jgi:hypothetical protein